MRVAILTGEGKAFCAGGDIAAWGALAPLEMGQDWVGTGHRVFDRLARLQGADDRRSQRPCSRRRARARGDRRLRICEAQAKLGLPETGIGIDPRLVGNAAPGEAVRRAGRAPPGADRRDRHAPRGARLGLVDEVVRDGRAASTRARALAGQVAHARPGRQQIAKQLINAAEGEDAAATMEILAGALVSYTDDLKEGVAGFREKRPPAFRGR